MEESKEFMVSEDGKKEIEKRLKDLLETAQVYNIPIFATAALSNTDTGTEYTSIVHSAAAHYVSLKDDRIQKHILIANGFEAVPVRDSLSLDMEEVF